MSTKRTLVQMDSDPEFARALVECLQARGINIVSVGNPAALVAELRTCQYPVVLLDIDFPGIDGLELLREIKRNDGCTQVIALTGADALALVIQSCHDGAEGCFPKSATEIESLAEAVEDAFRKTDRWWACLRDVVERKQTRLEALPWKGMETATPTGGVEPGDNGQACPVTNRRQWTRYPAEGRQVTVVANGSQHVAAVVDESFGGIGLLMEDFPHVFVGGEITLEYQGIPVQGLVRRIQAEEDGRYRVGIEWLRNPRRTGHRARPTVRRDQSMFVPLRGLQVACCRADDLANEDVSVRLPNGSIHNVNEGGLRSVTMAQRRRELEQLGQDANVLLGIYQLGKSESRESAIQAILDFEYSDSWN